MIHRYLALLDSWLWQWYNNSNAGLAVVICFVALD